MLCNVPSYRASDLQTTYICNTKIGITPTSPTHGVAHPTVTGLKQEISNCSRHKNHPSCLLKMQIPEFHTQKFRFSRLGVGHRNLCLISRPPPLRYGQWSWLLVEETTCPRELSSLMLIYLVWEQTVVILKYRSSPTILYSCKLSCSTKEVFPVSWSRIQQFYRKDALNVPKQELMTRALVQI